MDQRSLLNLGLAVALAALGALIWFQPGPAEPDSDQPLVFGALAEVSRLAVTGGVSAGGTVATRWALEKRADGWWLTAPYQVPADAVEVDALIRTLAGARSRARYAAGALDPVAVGLAAPTLELSVDDARYAFGGTESINYRRYVRAGDAVHLVDDLLHYRLTQDPAGLVSKRLLPPGAKLVRLELPGRTLARDAAGKWTLAPDDAAIGADALVALVERWERAAAVSVRPRSDGVVQARIRVGIEGAAAPLELQVLTAVDGLSLFRPDLGLEFSLPDAARAELLELAPTPVPPAPASD